jgi:hypothetical protein
VVAMELELGSCDGEKLSWGEQEGSFKGLGVRVGKAERLEFEYEKPSGQLLGLIVMSH